MTISGAGIRRMRLLRSMKQQHLAELLGVNQATVSRWERSQLAPSPEQAVKLERIFASPQHAAADAALKRLVEDSVRPVHLICDSTHRLLSASRPRQAEWRAPLAAFLGRSLFSYASAEIAAAEQSLEECGWHEGRLLSLTFDTGANDNMRLPIAAGRVTWERIMLADGSAGRLVTTVTEPAAFLHLHA
ncbi:helix-turn-helix transcriptional regulator [Rhizobium lentis]|uniref:Helix-turn-helix transcriptional regulator n=1 Tax=Rhizobium lentis TaxID=1138194 RepID=A0A9Q3MB50_9HYPH|nr:helix-turn-helix transcriptional regulator [Rhizobium lentis]MBX4959507.1 helix-turn-helix transcriptional regulator [Rhizobium lentis]MBX4977458.1 helix-turn-helix transcriptional regulator [Rhizobium lentis]MBX4989321.1 helix-turn-helix transcriptional regulator [Rhizobium lentis]MBX5007879.1 helix-turn-helix transcriptional regulator [Rhizobium lentis]MBX5011511.1 helix-turn-helix transcriptional regulator [Rhizobium lentis]